MPNDTKFAWSYSSLRAFETCPWRYYLTRVSKEVIEPETEVLKWGNEVHKVFDEYVNRMNKQNFHGGNVPDATDFRAYALVERLSHTNTIINILKQREDTSFQHWFDRMARMCRER